MRKIQYPVLERKWLRCRYCGTKLAIYDNTAQVKGGLYIKCRTCKKENEIKI